MNDIDSQAGSATSKHQNVPAYANKSASRRRRGWIVAAVVIAFASAAAAGIVSYDRQASKADYLTTSAARGNIYETVDATGTINAVTTVQVGAQVSGIISKLDADYNSRVHKGELLAQIDPRIYEAQLLQARATLESARANLAAAKANIANAQAKAAQAHADYLRATSLTRDGIMSPQDFDADKATWLSADTQVSANQALELQAAATVSQQEAALRVAETNLAYTNIYAPIDGTVIDRPVDVGQTVAATFQTPTLYTIARDLTKMQLLISTNEGDIGSVHVNSPVTFRVDAYPGQVFHGRISQVRMNATTVQNVVTYETVVDVSNPDLKLFPGMTAYATIPVQSVTNALTVPNAALRYNPDKSRAEVSAILHKYGIGVPRGSGTGSSTSNQPAVGTDGTALVWKLRTDQSIEPVLVRTGITDHTSTAVSQVITGTLKAGDTVVTAEQPKKSGFGG